MSSDVHVDLFGRYREQTEVDLERDLFRFERLPFALPPDAEFLYWTDAHRRAATCLEEGIERLSPITLLTGEIGAGKTTLVQNFLARPDPRLTIGLLSYVGARLDDLFAWIHLAFDRQVPPGRPPEQIAALQTFVMNEVKAGRRCVLILDEAQCASDEELEALRQLTNMNTGRHAMIQVVLVGQPSLRARLDEPRHAPLVARIGADEHLAAMAMRNTAGYVRHRLVCAGGPRDLFSTAALAEIHSAAAGIARNVNRLCDLCLCEARRRGITPIDAPLVGEILASRRPSGTFADLSGPRSGPAILHRLPASGDQPVASVQEEENGSTPQEAAPSVGTTDSSGPSAVRLTEPRPADDPGESRGTGEAVRRDASETVPQAVAEPPRHSAKHAASAAGAGQVRVTAGDFHLPAGAPGPAAAKPRAAAKTYTPKPAAAVTPAASAVPAEAVSSESATPKITTPDAAAITQGPGSGATAEPQPQATAGPATVLQEDADVVRHLAFSAMASLPEYRTETGAKAAKPTSELARRGNAPTGQEPAPAIDEATDAGAPPRAATPGRYRNWALSVSAAVAAIAVLALAAFGLRSDPEVTSTLAGAPVASASPDLDGVDTAGSGTPRGDTRAADEVPPQALGEGSEPPPALAAPRLTTPALPTVASPDSTVQDLYALALDLATVDPGTAAIAYARAASRGHARSAYYLAQLYETGDGVPRNVGLARAWYQLSDLPSAERRLEALAEVQGTAPLAAPRLLSASRGGDGVLELVWTGSADGGEAIYVVELFQSPGAAPLVTERVSRSALRLDAPGGELFWRVTVRDEGNATTSDLQRIPPLAG